MAGSVITFPVTVRAIQVRVVDGPALIAPVRGMGLPEARSMLEAYGDVEITLWPDWVSKVPTQADRITFTLGEPQPSATP